MLDEKSEQEQPEDEKCDCTSPDWWTDADDGFILGRDQMFCLKCGGE